MAPTNIDGSRISGATIDGQTVQEITVDGDTVFSLTPNRVVDDFEDGDLSEYQTGGQRSALPNTTGSGKSGGEAITSTSFQGNFAVKLSGSTTIYSTSGLDNYPSKGDKFEFRHYINSGTQSQGETFFGIQDGNNYYAIVHENTNNKFRLRVDDGGNISNLFSNDYSFPEDEWLRIFVDWGSDGSDTISVEVFDSNGNSLISDSVSNESRYTSGGIGFGEGKSDTNFHTAWDYFLTT